MIDSIQLNFLVVQNGFDKRGAFFLQSDEFVEHNEGRFQAPECVIIASNPKKVESRE